MNRSLNTSNAGLLLVLSILVGWDGTSCAQVAPVETNVEANISNASPARDSLRNGSQEIAPDDLMPLLLAHAHFENKDYSEAARGFQNFLRKYGSVDHPDAEVIKALNSLATSWIFLEEYARAVDTLNRLDKWIDDFSIPYRRGRCYERLEQYAAAAEEWRRAVAMEPGNPFLRVELAMLLVTMPDLRVRDGSEALSLLQGFESQIDDFPRIAVALAAAAAATDDFDKAVELQQRYLALSRDQDGKEHAQFLLDCYQQKQMPFPLFTRVLSPIEEEQRQVVLEQGTVLVRVRGRVSHFFSAQGFCEQENVERDHAGTVIDVKGLFLVSGATIGLNPSADNNSDNNRQSTWIDGPIIEVFSLAQSDPFRLGEAEIVGFDAATNLGVIRIKDSNPIDPIPGLRAIAFQPGHLVELAEKSDPCFSLEIQGGRTPRLPPEDALLTMMLTKDRPVSRLSSIVSPLMVDQDTYQVHLAGKSENAPIYVSNFVDWSEARLRIGQPIINRGGECVAIASPVIDRDGAERLVGIPARELSRVSAKLASYGQVERARLPYQVTPVAKRLSVNGESLISAGMQVAVAGNQSPLYTELDGQVILSVDGVPTPSTTDWLVAMERVATRKRDVIRCRVTAALGEIVRTVELPVLK